MPTNVVEQDRRSYKTWKEIARDWIFRQGATTIILCGVLAAAHQQITSLIKETIPLYLSTSREAHKEAFGQILLEFKEDRMRADVQMEKVIATFEADQRRDEESRLQLREIINNQQKQINAINEFIRAFKQQNGPPM